MPYRLVVVVVIAIVAGVIVERSVLFCYLFL
jgi:hypothetical protein